MYRHVFLFSMAALALVPASAQTSSAASNNFSESTSARPLEPAAAITLQQSLALALGANADLSAARNEVAALDASIEQAGARPDPEVSWLTEDTRRATRSTTLQVNQTIELGGKRAARIDAAARARDVATAELQARRADVRAAVVTAFFDVLAGQERLQLAEASAGLARRGAEAARRRVAAGKVAPVEETRARVAEATVRLELHQAISELANARKRLAATWGNPTPRFERAEGLLAALPDLPDRAALSARLATAPTIARARVEVTRHQAQAQLEHSRRTPDVTVSVGVKRSEELGRNQALLGVSIPFPLFDRNQGNLTAALRRTDKARDELASTALRLDTETAQAWERLQTARQEADALQHEILPGAQSAYDAAATGFEFGKFGFLDVLDAQRTLLLARSQYLHTLSEAHRAAAEIERLLGEPFAARKQ
jgi:cobalt-zinc-cadmium efflux system outer membrane protein